MRRLFSKFALTVSFLLAIIFTFSCYDGGSEQKCSGIVYDSDTYRCEAGELVGKCKGVDYYPAYQQCVGGVVVDGSPSSSSRGGLSSSGGGVTPTYSLDGIWLSNNNGNIHTINGNIGVYSQIPTTNVLWTSALNQGLISMGGESYRNLKSSGNLTWTGQNRVIEYNSSNPNVATGTDWTDCTLTLSADGQTIQYYASGVSTPNITLTRTNYSLDGVWLSNNNGNIHTINGSTGVYTKIPATNTLWTSALNQGLISMGGESYRNLKSSGNLTWTGQNRVIEYNSSNPNVATGTDWTDCTLTLSADGQTIQYYASGTSTPNLTLTRKQ